MGHGYTVSMLSDIIEERDLFQRSSASVVRTMQKAIANLQIQQQRVGSEGACEISRSCLKSLRQIKTSIEEHNHSMARLKGSITQLEQLLLADDGSTPNGTEYNRYRADEPVGAIEDRMSRSTESSVTDELLQTYYERAGALRVLQDRFRDFEEDFTEEDADGVLQGCDIASTIQMSDLAFEEAYHAQRQTLVCDIEAAQKAQDAAKEACHMAGFSC